ncbi:MAG: phosphotransferase, partial [bacterium]|nr:phosphotransferase [bacterium]
RYVLIHNDFWRGNVLLDSTRSGPWPERFVVIDWGGSRVRGHAIFDLIRMADCLKLGDRVLRGEVEAHCRILECELIDARSHLFSALGHLAMNLDRFPLPRFLEMAQQCVQRLDSAIPESAS